ncbi:MAG: glycosyltransferase family 2 protein [Alphaproteobacteria bacterium]
MVGTSDVVSLGIAAFNEERHVGETLESIRVQTHRDLEVHIFDNASTDATGAICRPFLSDGRFHYHRNAVNIGAVRNFNRVHAVARGDFVVPMSANDILQPTYLERLLEVMRRDPANGLVAARMSLLDDASQPVPQDEWLPQRVFETDCGDPVRAAATVMRSWHYPNYFFGMYRRSVMERLQPQRFLYGGDVAFVCELALYANIRFVDETLIHIRRHGRPQVGHLVRAFSEDVLYGTRPGSIFSRFDLVMPFVDFTWAYLEMIALAGIADEQKGILSRIAISTQRRLHGRQMRAEVAALLRVGEKNEGLWSRPANLLQRCLLARRLLDRVSRAFIVYPDEPALADLCRRLAAALAPPPA